MSAILSPRELITVAIQIEKNGYNYYTRMAASARHSQVKEIFTLLAQAEGQHVVEFTRIQNSMVQEDFKSSKKDPALDLSTYLQALADGHVFGNQIAVDQIIKNIKTDEQALQHAISLEKDSVIFYYEIYSMLPEQEPNRKALFELIHQEKIHITRLYTMMNLITKS